MRPGSLGRGARPRSTAQAAVGHHSVAVRWFRGSLRSHLNQRASELAEHDQGAGLDVDDLAGGSSSPTG